MVSRDHRIQAYAVTPGVGVGITEEVIHNVVHAFYADIRRDPALGPIFNRVIADRWDMHLSRMCDFWSSVLLMTGRFKGSPMQVHAAIGGLRATHFARWLHIFRLTVQRICPNEAAALFIRKAEMIGESLLLGIQTMQRQQAESGPRTGALSGAE